MSPVRPVQVSPTSSLLPLKYPQSVGVFDNYEAAQRAVDYLSDHEFPVENLCIVGTDLKLVERVLGRRGWPQVLAGGAMSGLGTGVLLGLLWTLFMPSISWGAALLSGIVLGLAMGMLSAAMGHAATRGQRDFSSVTATVATRYEVLGEHQVVGRAREMLQEMPGFRAQQMRGQGLADPSSTSVGQAPSVASAPPISPAQSFPQGQSFPQAPSSQSAPSGLPTQDVDPASVREAPQPPADSQQPSGYWPGASWGGTSPQGNGGATAWQGPDASASAQRPQSEEPRPQPIYAPWPDHSHE